MAEAVSQDRTSVTGPQAGAPASPRWSGRSRGGYFGNWFFVQLIRVAGLRAAYAWLVFVAAYFTLASPRAYRASADYLRRILGPCPFWRRPMRVYRHFFSFGVTLLDRFAVVMGCARMEWSFEGEERFREFLDRGKGIILVGAHLGSWEIAGHLLGRLNIPVNLVVLEKEQENIRRLLDQALEGKRFRILTTDENPLRSVPIMAALRRGEMVAMLGDRAFGGADVAVPFLGGNARLPVGAYILAAITGAPVFHVFAVRQRIGAYRFFTSPAEFVPRDAARRGSPTGVRDHVARYAQRLESVLRDYPWQWYNFYPFWEESPAAASTRS